MKTKKELNALKEEVKTMNEKLSALTEEELEQVTGGNDGIIWLCEESFDHKKSNHTSGSIQAVIGEWTNEEHSLK